MSSKKLVECIEDVERFTCRKPYNRFMVWKGSDFWHQDLSVQIRLEPDGNVYLSTEDTCKRPCSLQSATITIEQFHAAIRQIIMSQSPQTELA